MKNKIIFFAKNAGFIRFNKDILIRLAKTFKIFVIFETNKVFDEEDILSFFKKNFENEIIFIENKKINNSTKFTNGFKKMLEYLHYQNPIFDNNQIIKKKFFLKINRNFQKERIINFKIPELARIMLIKIIEYIIYLVSYDHFIKSKIDEIKPNISIFTNLVWPLTPQIDYINICKKNNIPTVYLVNSWDNLTNKGNLKSSPDYTIVWNKEQKKELNLFHNYKGKVIISGSSTYYKWKKNIKFYDKKILLKKVNLKNINKNIITYLCSSPTICPGDTELQFVKKWIYKLRNSKNKKINSSNIIIRPHPQNNTIWNKFRMNNCSIFPKKNVWIVRNKSIEDFYNNVKHSIFVVGKNTSNMIEASILGKQVFTVLDKNFKPSNSIHYNYLKKYNITKESKSLDEHIHQIENFVEKDCNFNINRNTFVFQDNINPLNIIEDNISKMILKNEHK